MGLAFFSLYFGCCSFSFISWPFAPFSLLGRTLLSESRTKEARLKRERQFYLLLPSFTRFYWVLLSSTVFFLLFSGFYWVLPGLTGFTGFYWVFTRFYRVLLGSIGS